MTDDDDNVVHFAPRADAPDEQESHVPNPLNLRRELQRNALTKGLVTFDEFGQHISCNGRSHGQTSRPKNCSSRGHGPMPTTPRLPNISTAAGSSVSGAIWSVT